MFKPSWQKQVINQLDRVRMLNIETVVVLGEFVGVTFHWYSGSAAVNP